MIKRLEFAQNCSGSLDSSLPEALYASWKAKRTRVCGAQSLEILGELSARAGSIPFRVYRHLLALVPDDHADIRYSYQRTLHALRRTVQCD